MTKLYDSFESLERLPVSRRSFVKGAFAAGAAAALYGCGSSSSDVIYGDSGGGDGGIVSEDDYFTETPLLRYGTSGHNCGGRCIIKAQLTADGRVVRFLTDEAKYAYDGTSIDNDNRNSTQSRACSRCRAYKTRIYHPGRLKYPLKQTKERGDMTGFIRITWSEALTGITDRLKAVQQAYGNEALHAVYACGSFSSNFQGGSYTGLFTCHDWGHGAALRLLGGSSRYTSDYSFHQASYMGAYGAIGGYSGLANMNPSANDIAGTGKYIVLWGANIPTTHNPYAFPWVKGIEDMKARDPQSKVIFIGPEFSECGITFADEWIQSRPYTDVALIHGMLHEMIINTVDANGNLLPAGERWLDLDYLDAMVYGFFDSPEHWMDQGAGGGTPGTISSAGQPGYVKIDAVPAGRSLSAYIMGNDDRLTKLAYGTDTYTANYYTENFGTGTPKKLMRNQAICSYNGAATSMYAYKRDMQTPKNKEWASQVTGVPAERIKELAKIYVDAAKAGRPIWNEWSGGQLKQAEGCTTLFAIQSLLIITQNWGITGTGIANKQMGRAKQNNPNQITDGHLTPATWSGIPAGQLHPRISVTQWHNALKFAFGDQLKGKYAPNIPDWQNGLGTGKAYYDDGGVKALIKRDGISTYTVTGSDNIIRTYYDFTGRSANTPVFSGYRFILNSGGNIPVNQHANTKDNTEMLRHLPTYGYEEGAGNIEKKDAFYLVTFDNFMSPSAQYSDYVLPAKTAWEQEDFIEIEASGNLYVDAYISGPGESKSTWDFSRELVKAYGGAATAQQFTGAGADTTFRQVMQNAYVSIKNDPSSPFYKKTWDEFLEKPISHAKPIPEATSGLSKSSLRQAYEAADLTAPNFFNIPTYDALNHDGMFGLDEFAETETCPHQTMRFHVYSGSLVWRYRNLFSKWHGYLSLEEQGQNNKDDEGDDVVFPIPMYFDYRDYFREAYHLSNTEDLAGRYLLTTTHDRFRAHSSQAENPYLRELTHRTIGGALYSGNDAGTYAISSNPAGNMNEFPPLNSLIGEDGLPVANAHKRASYMDLWVNEDDFADMKDGDLVKVENEIGAVYCTLRKTKRCVPGFVGLHQGCWFDPRVINGEVVDVGGNCNTLMSSKPSRIDHGNAQQSAMVKITKVR